MNKQGVYFLVAHLVITLAVITGYFINLIMTGHSDETLKMAVIVIIGYWFGAIGKNTIDDVLPTVKSRDKHE